MANIHRSAKSGNEWAVNDLDAYNITIISQDATAFFGYDPQTLHNDNLVQNHSELLSKLTADKVSNEDKDAYEVLQYMKLATGMGPVLYGEYSIVDFVRQLLYTIEYTGREVRRIVRCRVEFSFLTCWESKNTITELCVTDFKDQERDGIFLLVVHEDKKRSNAELGYPKAQLVAEAIAAGQKNNNLRDERGLDALEYEEMAVIVMQGSTPTFFKIPVTRELIQAVQRGAYPPTPTVVALHRPLLPMPLTDMNTHQGMRGLENRRIILACF